MCSLLIYFSSPEGFSEKLWSEKLRTGIVFPREGFLESGMSQPVVCGGEPMVCTPGSCGFRHAIVAVISDNPALNSLLVAV